MIRRDNSSQQTLAILVGGGPAPGINGVIASATIEAINCGMRVLGLRDGYRWLAEGDISHVVELKIPDVSRIHFSGGSILRTSRTNPARSASPRISGPIQPIGRIFTVEMGPRRRKSRGTTPRRSPSNSTTNARNSKFSASAIASRKNH